MKTYILNIIPKIQRFSSKLDNTSILTNKHWQVVDFSTEGKTIFIFREKNNQLLISTNGKIEKALWEFIGNNSMIVDKSDGSYLYRHGFLDENILALKVDGTEEYLLLINEQRFNNEVKKMEDVLNFMEVNYTSTNQNFRVNRKRKSESEIKNFTLQKLPEDLGFNDLHYPYIRKEIEKINTELLKTNKKCASSIIISFAKHHTIKTDLFNENHELSELLAKETLKIPLIEQIFKLNLNKPKTLTEFENFLRKEIKTN